MLILSSLLLWVVIQVLIDKSQTKPQATLSEDPPICRSIDVKYCQEDSIKTKCIHLCSPKDSGVCTFISKDKCTDAHVIKECPQKCSRPAIAMECGSYQAVAHIPSIDERIRNAGSKLKDIGGTAALYKSTTELRSINHICGAILISDRYLLTAAHCLPDSIRSFSISLGEDDLNENTSPGDDTYEITDTILHPLYNKTVSKYHDIAIIKTNRRVHFRTNIWPFCLPGSQQVYTDYQALRIAGWGKVDAKHKANTIQSEFVTLVKTSRCEDIWMKKAPDLYKEILAKDYQDGLQNTVICAGRPGVDACNGDSGGPLTYQNSEGLQTIIGVISRGIGGCPKFPELPAFYMNIIHYVDWIYNVTGLPGVSTQHPNSTPKPTDQWSTWSPWNVCSVTCGGGQRNRIRKCTNPITYRDATSCTGINSQMENCNIGQCPRNDQWSTWSLWSVCSATCGGGQQNRIRKCINPITNRDATRCAGSNSQIENCNIGQCPRNDQWSTWSPWSVCSATCGGGQRNRIRKCTNLITNREATRCAGSNSQKENCNIGLCPRNVTDCPTPYFRLGLECFLVVGHSWPEMSEWRNWTDARSYCYHSQGGDLAQPNDTKALADFLVDDGYDMDYFWLGGSDMDSEGTWLWIAGSTIDTATGWESDQPNDYGGRQDCLTMLPGAGGDNSLDDLGCEQAWPFVCER